MPVPSGVPVSSHMKAARSEPAERRPSLLPRGQRVQAHLADRETREAFDGQGGRSPLPPPSSTSASGHPRGSPLESSPADGLSPSPQREENIGLQPFFSPAGFEATWRWETRKMPKSNARSPEGTCWSPRRPWPRWNSPNLPNSLAVSARQSPKTPARASPAQPLAGGSDLLPRRRMQGPRSADPLPLHGPVPPFLAPLQPSAAGREPPDFAGTQEDTPRREQTLSAISPNTLLAFEAAEGARPAGRSRGMRGPAPTPRLPWAGRDGAILLPSHHDRDSQGGERGRGGGSTSGCGAEARGSSGASPRLLLSLLLLISSAGAA